MKNIFSLAIILLAVFFITSCDKEDDTIQNTATYDYQIQIHNPNTDNKKVNDVLEIEIEFESLVGKSVENINVSIYNKADSTEIYNKPDQVSVNELDGQLVYQDMMMLSSDNGVAANTYWILEASVWGIADRDGAILETVEFYVQPE